MVDCPVKVDIKDKLTSVGSQQKVDSDHIGCSFSAVNGNSLDVSGTAGSNYQRSSGKDNRGSDPTTPDGRISEAEDLNILEAEIEKAWNKVVNRKKSKKRK